MTELKSLGPWQLMEYIDVNKAAYLLLRQRPPALVLTYPHDDLQLAEDYLRRRFRIYPPELPPPSSPSDSLILLQASPDRILAADLWKLRDKRWPLSALLRSPRKSAPGKDLKERRARAIRQVLRQHRVPPKDWKRLRSHGYSKVSLCEKVREGHPNLFTSDWIFDRTIKENRQFRFGR